MSDNNYCGYYKDNLCVGPDGKVRTCSIDFESIYDKYTKTNRANMCGRKQKWDNAKKSLETKVQ